MKIKILKNSEKKSHKRLRICDRIRECKQEKCPHAILHKKTKSCKQHICSLLSNNRYCNCVKEK
jgi:hypothetical protein